MVLCNVGKRSHCRCVCVCVRLCVFVYGTVERTNEQNTFVSYCCEKTKFFFVGNKKWLSQTSLETSYFFVVSHFKLINIFMRIANLSLELKKNWKRFPMIKPCSQNFWFIFNLCFLCSLFTYAHFKTGKLVDHTYTPIFNADFFVYASFLNFSFYCYSIFLFARSSLLWLWRTCLPAWSLAYSVALFICFVEIVGYFVCRFCVSCWMTDSFQKRCSTFLLYTEN